MVNGLLIIENPKLVIQFRFPRSKKKRIRKKWSKNPLNFKPDEHVYISHDRCLAHPLIARLIMEHKDIKVGTFK